MEGTGGGRALKGLEEPREAELLARILEFVIGCRHHTLGRPITALNFAGKPEGDPYVVCLDCGRHLAYDAETLKVGRAI